MLQPNQKTQILIGGIRVSPDASEHTIIEHARKAMKRAGAPVSSLHFRLYKRSIDARHKDDIRLVCTVLAQSEEPLTDKVKRILSRMPDVR